MLSLDGEHAVVDGDGDLVGGEAGDGGVHHHGAVRPLDVERQVAGRGPTIGPAAGRQAEPLPHVIEDPIHLRVQVHQVRRRVPPDQCHHNHLHEKQSSKHPSDTSLAATLNMPGAGPLGALAHCPKGCSSAQMSAVARGAVQTIRDAGHRPTDAWWGTGSPNTSPSSTPPISSLSRGSLSVATAPSGWVLSASSPRRAR